MISLVKLLSVIALLLATSVCIHAALPRFSWDTLPVFFHSCNASGLYNPEAIRAISKYPMVTVSQAQGHLVKDMDDEDAMVLFLRAVKEANPNTTTYYYFNSFKDKLDLSRTARQFEAHPNWALRDKNGIRVKNSQNNYVFDLSQVEVRQWLLNICLNGTDSAGGDGCYCDASQHTFDQHFHPPVSPQRMKTWGEGLLNLTREVQDALGNERLLIGKAPDQPYVKAAEIEFFRPNNDSINNLTEGVRNGKVMQAHMALGAPCEGDITDYLAAFLVAVGKYSYYGCGNWSTTGNDSSFFWHPYYDKPLGAPLGPATYMGRVWKRQFASGTKVTFDTSNNKGTIEWGSAGYT